MLTFLNKEFIESESGLRIIRRNRLRQLNMDYQEDEQLLEAMQVLVEQEMQMMVEEMNVLEAAMGHLGGRIMGALEDNLDIDGDDYDAVWQAVTVNVEEYRIMGDPSFRLHFRLSKPTYEVLLQTCATHLIDAGRVQRVREGLDIPLLMVLWILANPDTFRSVALRFGVRPGTVHYHYSYIIEALREMAPRFIQWPNEAERAQIKARFEAYSGFPGVIGCIDGTFNVVTAPAVQKERFVNRHHSYSFNSMVVCDDNLLIRAMHIGEVGSLHDQRVFRRSPLYRNLLQDDNEEYVCMDEHIVGDGAYAVTDFLMVPFRNVGNLLPQQRNFNRGLSKCRVRIEHAFGKAFGQWRRMKMLHSLNLELAVDHFTACFVLHNFMILNGEVLLDLDDPWAYVPALNDDNIEGIDDDDDDNLHINPIPELHQLEVQARIRGVEKRLALVYNM